MAVRVPLIALAVIASFASGCGGGGGSDGIDSKLVDRANAICQTQRQEITSIPQPTKVQAAQLAAYLRRVLPIAKQANADFHDLAPPKGHEQTWKKLLRQSDDRLRQLERMLAAATGGSQVAFQLAQQRLTAADHAFTTTAHDIGLVECAAPESSPSG